MKLAQDLGTWADDSGHECWYILNARAAPFRQLMGMPGPNVVYAKAAVAL